ncbi:hypothetical protein [Streptomyces enissocaesilis]
MPSACGRTTERRRNSIRETSAGPGRWALGAERLAAAVRTWSVDGRIIAVGSLDDPDVLRLTTAPDLRQDGDPARRLLADLDDPERGVLPPGKVGLEIPDGALLREVLLEAGWTSAEPPENDQAAVSDRPRRCPWQGPNALRGHGAGRGSMMVG